MRYDENDAESRNVEDRRGERSGMRLPGGGLQIPIGGGGFSFTSLLVIGAIMLFMGINPLEVLLGNGGGGQVNLPQLPRSERPSSPRNADDIPGLPGSRQAGGSSSQVPAADDDMKVFTARVLKDTEDVWHQVFKSFGQTYTDPQMVIYSGVTRTACGAGQAAMGPFYCPLDQKVYIDLSFYEEMKRKFNASGDFAHAYVVAHEIGHHVQNLLGIAEKVQDLRNRSDERESNQISVRMELQADCLAGVWANLNDQMKNRLQPGDVESALNAAAQIGDDMIQKKISGRVVPDAFTHGTAAQRVRWFKTGIESGKMEACDTFNTSNP